MTSIRESTYGQNDETLIEHARHAAVKQPIEHAPQHHARQEDGDAGEQGQLRPL